MRQQKAKSCLTADTSVLIFVTVMVVQAPLRAVIFTTTGPTMTASASQLLQNLPHTTFFSTAHHRRKLDLQVPSDLAAEAEGWTMGIQTGRQ
jgi:hypothetical protein